MSNKDNDKVPSDYIVVIDAGSKGTRAFLYKSTQVTGANLEERSDDWFTNVDSSKSDSYPRIELIKKKKIKPGISEYVNDLNQLDKHYMGKLLEPIEKHIPKSQLSRTPIFLHATGGTRVLKIENQEKILGKICSYLQKNHHFYLPDCLSHINTISGETEGLYGWIGINYKYGAFQPRTQVKDKTLGLLDLGGASSQLAFEPLDFTKHNDEFLHKVNLDFTGEGGVEYSVFSQSFLGGINQAYKKHQERVVEKYNSIDPCLPAGAVQSFQQEETSKKFTIEGSGNFRNCIDSLYNLLTELSVDKYCKSNDETSIESCIVSDFLPKMDFKVSNFVGINEFHDNLEDYSNYDQFYSKTKTLCNKKVEMASEKKEKDDFDECFKSIWIINILHQSLGFPRYEIDESEPNEESSSFPVTDFKILDDFSWTLGRAVLYEFYENAKRLGLESPTVGYFEPRSTKFIPGGEIDGVSMRPEAITNISDKAKEPQTDDGEDDDNEWNQAFENHRLYGSIFFLVILIVIVYLMLGRAKRQSIGDALKRIYHERLRPIIIPYQTIDRVGDDGDLELGDIERHIEQNEQLQEDNEEQGKKDSFEIE
ncbi:hypothetical protein WICMUC_000474 [Wickerhamomyces mucosus]|uniref:Golgi apyrase n=1 Tax=Wickerhamomyces mucosus TaxID=1378264 RepID=A0A9P8TIN0_9ASCO|nr:hypothetical protein WICMUC_000474 [Wickerhamomyces mucosus]